jgi:transposase, IS5 family
LSKTAFSCVEDGRAFPEFPGNVGLSLVIFAMERAVRVAYPRPTTLDVIPIPEVPLNVNCRDEIVPILASLQHLYADDAARDEILTLIAKDVNATSDQSQGRPGLGYWEILVLGAVRLGCNFDYDKLQNLAEEHRSLRRIMGIGTWDDQDPRRWDWRRIQDNLCLVHPETLAKINELVVRAGHRLEPTAAEKVRGDTFVVKTNIHYPTDANLLADGLRKILHLGAQLALLLGQLGWRQEAHLCHRAKRLVRAINKACKSKKGDMPGRRRRAYRPLMKLTGKLLARARQLLQGEVQWRSGLNKADSVTALGLDQQLEHYVELTAKVLEQTRRRVVLGESVPNTDKVFSMFEPHTELINRGKTPQPVEFGHRVLVLEDQLGFIVHYQVLGNGVQDKDVAVSSLKAAQSKVGDKIVSASFDRGFHTPENQRELAGVVAHPCVPVRGAKQEVRQQAEATIEFRQGRKRHAGVESAIHGLGAGNGLDRCRDRTKRGYERYVGLGILGRNLHVLGKVALRRQAEDCLAGQSKRTE